MERQSVDITTTDDPTTGHTKRRTYLKAFGGGATALAMGGLAGCLGEGSGETATDTSASADSTDSTGTPAVCRDSLHPRFGFVGESKDAPAPVAADHEVNLLIGEREDGPVPEFYFDPTGLLVEPGDVVEFFFATPDHAVTAFHPGLGRTARVPDGVPALSSPMLTAGTYWLYRFDTPGVYDLYCPPHEQFGMAMRVVVGEATGPGAKPVSMQPPKHGEPRPPMATAATVLNDDALAPEAIVENGQVAWGDLAPESKQLQQGSH